MKLLVNAGSKRKLQLRSESKGKKKSPRQIFLAALMGFTSGDRGEEMASAFAKGDHGSIEGMMDDLKQHMVEEATKIANRAKK